MGVRVSSVPKRKEAMDRKIHLILALVCFPSHVSLLLLGNRGLMNVWIAIPEPPKARVRDVESLGSMRGEKEVDRGVILETAEAHQRASPASANVARYMGGEACEGFVI